MELDNSQIALWNRCPAAWYERYVNNLEPAVRPGYLSFGTRIHVLLANHYRTKYNNARHEFPPPLEGFYKNAPMALAQDTPMEDPTLEAEAQALFEAYLAHVGAEEHLRVIAVEQPFGVPLPWLRNCQRCQKTGYMLVPINNGDHYSCGYCGRHADPLHTLTGVIDLVVHDTNINTYYVIDHKSQQRGGGYNTLEAWQMRPQGVLYYWAVQELAKTLVPGFRPDRDLRAFKVNVLTRRSPKGQIGPSFNTVEPYYDSKTMDTMVQYAAETADAMARPLTINTVHYNRGACVNGRSKCDFYHLHFPGSAREYQLEIFYHPAEAYFPVGELMRPWRPQPELVVQGFGNAAPRLPAHYPWDQVLPQIEPVYQIAQPAPVADRMGNAFFQAAENVAVGRQGLGNAGAGPYHDF